MSNTKIITDTQLIDWFETGFQKPDGHRYYLAQFLQDKRVRFQIISEEMLFPGSEIQRVIGKHSETFREAVISAMEHEQIKS